VRSLHFAILYCMLYGTALGMYCSQNPLLACSVLRGHFLEGLPGKLLFFPNKRTNYYYRDSLIVR
jgi:hypothetical protein